MQITKGFVSPPLQQATSFSAPAMANGGGTDTRSLGSTVSLSPGNRGSWTLGSTASCSLAVTDTACWCCPVIHSSCWGMTMTPVATTTPIDINMTCCLRKDNLISINSSAFCLIVLKSMADREWHRIFSDCCSLICRNSAYNDILDIKLIHQRVAVRIWRINVHLTEMHPSVGCRSCASKFATKNHEMGHFLDLVP